MGKINYLIILLILSACVHREEHVVKSGNTTIEREYFENGNIKYESSYKFGKLNGISRSWTRDGKIISSIEYKNDLLYGKWETYYPSNGMVKNSINYLNGKKNGKEIWYHQNGQKQSEVYYDNDIISSDIQRWDENGKQIIN